ncbi:MAG: PHP domain-containing protein [Bacteroidales bacterium]|nr:PHP domain-containing protein [Bacteroidales bacterium]MDZ4059265.1 PHP domain-containing protein [Bacteroidales bacterium]
MMKCDLHIHTTLSPCGDIEMTPLNIIAKAKERGLDIIGITDHNSTLQSRYIREVGEREGIYVMCGAEITTKEEVHVLAFVDGEEALERLQEFLDKSLVRIPNNPDIFGYQLVVNQNEEVLYQEDSLLIGVTDKSIEEVEQFVHSLGGIFIPAHIDKQQNSVLSQLGFMPPSLSADALELSSNCTIDAFITQNSYLSKRAFIQSSDAHYTDDIGKCYTRLDIMEKTFSAVKSALNNLKR